MEPSGCPIGEIDGLTFWRATPEDYGEVMSISQGIYRGNDYLPHRYSAWMTEPDRVVILARRATKLVALESGLVVDGGDTMILEGLRVCPSERGQGVAGIIQRFADSYMKKLYPTLKFKRLTRADDPGPEKLSKFKLLAKRAILSFGGEAESFDGFIKDLQEKVASQCKATGSSVQQIPLDNEDQVRAVLLEPGIASRLDLPGGSIIQDWQPLKPIESNLAVLRRRDLLWFVAGTLDMPLFVSFHTPPYPVPFQDGALRFNIDLYGTDSVMACEALLAHLEKARPQLKGTVIMHVYMHDSVQEALGQFCQSETGVQKWRSTWAQYFLEREL